MSVVDRKNACMRGARLKIGTWESTEPWCYIIAEIGSNHDNDLEHALEMIRLAAEAGADAVKFQSFTAKTLQSKMNWNGDQPIPSPQFDALAQVELDDTWLETLAERANRYGVDFFVHTVF